MPVELCLEWLAGAAGFEGSAAPRAAPPGQVPPHSALICRKRLAPMCGRCPAQPVTHARAAGHSSPRGRPSQGSEWPQLHRGAGWPQAEVGRECSGRFTGVQAAGVVPGVPTCQSQHSTPRFCPGSGSKRGGDSSSEGSRGTPRPGVPGHCLWPDPRSGGQRELPEAPSALETGPGHGERGLFLEARPN